LLVKIFLQRLGLGLATFGILSAILILPTSYFNQALEQFKTTWRHFSDSFDPFATVSINRENIQSTSSIIASEESRKNLEQSVAYISGSPFKSEFFFPPTNEPSQPIAISPDNDSGSTLPEVINPPSPPPQNIQDTINEIRNDPPGEITKAVSSMLNEARVTLAEGSVGIVAVDSKQTKMPLRRDDQISRGQSFMTEKESRCELKLNESTTLRLASNTQASFRPGSREIILSKGYLLVEVPHQKPTTIKTPHATAKLMEGTVFVQQLKKQVSFFLFRGKLSVGDHQLKPGQALINRNGNEEIALFDLQRGIQVLPVFKGFPTLACMPLLTAIAKKSENNIASAVGNIPTPSTAASASSSGSLMMGGAPANLTSPVIQAVSQTASELHSVLPDLGLH